MPGGNRRERSGRSAQGASYSHGGRFRPDGRTGQGNANLRASLWVVVTIAATGSAMRGNLSRWPGISSRDREHPAALGRNHRAPCPGENVGEVARQSHWSQAHVTATAKHSLPIHEQKHRAREQANRTGRQTHLTRIQTRRPRVQTCSDRRFHPAVRASSARGWTIPSKGGAALGLKQSQRG